MITASAGVGAAAVSVGCGQSAARRRVPVDPCASTFPRAIVAIMPFAANIGVKLDAAVSDTATQSSVGRSRRPDVTGTY
jgi:hypothetical protein